MTVPKYRRYTSYRVRSDPGKRSDNRAIRKDVTLSLRVLLFASALVARPIDDGRLTSLPAARLPDVIECHSSQSRALLGLIQRPLSLSEMVQELERGCLALDEVRFRPGEDTIEPLSPARFEQVARALGMASGAYRITVPAEAIPGEQPDTLQARRRGARLREALVRSGASAHRLLEDGSWRFPGLVAAPGTAIPMLVRVSDP